LPEHFDVLVIGAGTAGCVLAARLSENEGRSVCLVEAGPDPGSFDGGRWPAEMLDARSVPTTHDWGHEGDVSLLRARIVGGCSAHNACFVVWGAREDYDKWSSADERWSFSTLEPCLRRAEGAIRTRPAQDSELSGWHRAILEGAPAIGIPRLDDFNELDAGEGVAPVPLNAVGDVRWNSAFAYLDPARERPNLRVHGDTMVERVSFARQRAAGAVVRRDGERTEIGAELVILAAGSYGSPAILLRSGVGPEQALRGFGVDQVAALDGVGANLIDHPGVSLFFEPSEGLLRELADQDEAGLLFEGQAAVRAKSAACEEGLWDLQLLPWASRRTDEPGAGPYETHITSFVLRPRSRGRVTLRSIDPEDRPQVEQRFFSDPEGADLAAVVDGVERIRELVAAEPVAPLAAAELVPGPAIAGRSEMAAWARGAVRGFFHPVGTCRIGPASDPQAVVDGAGSVHGVENLVVADASIMPTIPRANTNLATAAVAERVAELIG
jgi:choline dehydrogenase